MNATYTVDRTDPNRLARCYGLGMEPVMEQRQGAVGPSHVPSGAVLLAIELSEIAHGIRGLDVLRRSVDRAPPL